MSGFEIVSQNMTGLDVEQMSLIERRFAHISELANELAKKLTNKASGTVFFRDPAFVSLYKKLALRDMTKKYDYPSFNENILRSFSKRLSVMERAYLCGEINKLCGSEDPLYYLEKSEDSEEIEADTVAYLRNYYSDEAYRKFSEELQSLQVVYNNDFTGVCEDVYDNLVKFCILPIENTNDGVLNSFHSLISKYELKTVMTCDVSTADGEGFTRFALLKKNVEILPTEERTTYASFLFDTSDQDSGFIDVTIADILSVAECFGLILSKLGSHADPHDNVSVCEAVFRADGGDLAGFLCFLQMEVPFYTVLGIYSHIPEF